MNQRGDFWAVGLTQRWVGLRLFYVASFAGWALTGVQASAQQAGGGVGVNGGNRVGGIRYVTRQAPLAATQGVARDFFNAGGVVLGAGGAGSGASAGSGVVGAGAGNAIASGGRSSAPPVVVGGVQDYATAQTARVDAAAHREFAEVTAAAQRGDPRAKARLEVLRQQLNRTGVSGGAPSVAGAARATGGAAPAAAPAAAQRR